MLTKWRALLAGLLVIGMIGPSFGQIELRIGDVTVPPADVSSAACIQVPIFIFDPMDNRDLRDLTFTVEFSGSTEIINGGVTTDMLVSNAFIDADLTGLTSPGTDLVNDNGSGSPSCGLIFNQATQGSASAANFAAGTDNGSWFLNNNDAGRKKAFIIDLFNNNAIGFTTQNTEMLVAVLEIPIVANPGQTQLLITATPNGMVPGANTYTWDDGLRTDDQGNRVQIPEDLVLPLAPASVNIFDPVNCSGATASAPITWSDPNDGGTGGTVDFTFPGTTNADRVHLVGDGIDEIIASGGATTLYSLTTDPDTSPNPAGDPSYTATYEVEFPPASGTYVSGTACNLTPAWAAASCASSWSTPPIFGGNTDFNVTLTNAMWDGAKYGTVTGPGGLSVDLTVPTSGAGTNSLTFTSVFSVMGIDSNDVGTYTVSGNGPGATNTFSCDLVLSLEPPVLDGSICGSITSASIEGSVDITLAGNEGVITYSVTYNGVTTSGLPAGVYTLNGITADDTDVTITGHGFDAGGNPDTDEVTCDLDFALPTCTASQDPIGTVDVGTVITLFLDTTNAVAATVEGVAMTPDVDADNNFNVQWSASHVAIADTTLTGTVTNADGETTTCTWIIDINCIDPIIVDVAPVGDSGITVYGTFACDYTVRIIEHNTGAVNDYTVTIDNLTNVGLNEGTGFLNVVIPADAWIEVGQLGLAGGATDMIPTVPTLGEWGMIALILSLMGAGLMVMRRRQLV